MAYTPLYYREGTQLFGVECHHQLDDHVILNRLSSEERAEASHILTMEKSFINLKLDVDMFMKKIKAPMSLYHYLLNCLEKPC